MWEKTRSRAVKELGASLLGENNSFQELSPCNQSIPEPTEMKAEEFSNHGYRHELIPMSPKVKAHHFSRAATNRAGITKCELAKGGGKKRDVNSSGLHWAEQSRAEQREILSILVGDGKARCSWAEQWQEAEINWLLCESECALVFLNRWSVALLLPRIEFCFCHKWCKANFVSLCFLFSCHNYRPQSYHLNCCIAFNSFVDLGL